MYKFILVAMLIAMYGFTSSAQTADTNYLTFRIGSNFDFMNNNLTLNKVFGELRYTNDSILVLGNKRRLSIGLDIGGSRSNSLTVTNSNYISHSGFIDPINTFITPDTLRILSQTIKSKQSIGFGQLTLFINPTLTYSFNSENHPNSVFRLAIGAYADMYRATSYIKYSDTSVLKQDTFKVAKNTRFVATNFNDSIGTTSTYGYFGVSFAMMLYSKIAVIKFKTVIGRVITGNNDNNTYVPTKNFYSPQNVKFYLIDASITEPRSKISIQANIRGLFPNQTPVWGVYATKTFDVEKLYDAITN